MLLRVRSITYLAQRINAYELVDCGGGDLPPFEAGAHVSVRVGDGPVRDFSLWNDPAERARRVESSGKAENCRGGGGEKAPCGCLFFQAGLIRTMGPKANGLLDARLANI